MIKKFILYLKALKVLFIKKSLKKSFFYMYDKDLDVQRFDDDMLITQLCYFGHHTEKALKHHNRGDRGQEKRNKLELLLKEAEKREIQEVAIFSWAKKLIEYYDECKDIYVRKINGSSVHPDKDIILDFIRKRTTTRFWQSKLISDEILNDILEVSMTSSLSCNRQTIRFVIKKNSLDNMVLGDSNNTSMFQKAPVTIYVADDGRFFPEKYANALDVGGVCSLIQLAASSYGISSTWMYYAESYDQDEIRKKLGLKKYMYVYSAISLGYPNDHQEKPPRCDISRFIL